MEIAGRKKERQILKEAYDSDKGELIALYGRRRVGKTFLIKNFFENLKCVFVYVSGMNGGTYSQQLANFASALRQTFISGLKTPQNWMEAFQLFTEITDSISKEKRIVLFLDELPWLATHKSQLLSALDYYWNRHWSHNPKNKVVICGSAASWMLDKIIYNKGGLYNRVTCQFRLEPFTLKETKEYLKHLHVELNNRHILELYMATGGIPYYLSKIRRNLSAAENIEELAFNKQGVLYQDFDILFSSLFERADVYVELIKIISQNRYGIAQEDLLRKTQLVSSGGTAKQKLRDLEEAGFITSFLSYGHKRKGIYYRLIDEYSFFYLKWIEQRKASSRKMGKASWIELRATPSWKSWSGYAFETICYKHVEQIRHALNLNTSAIATTWRHEGTSKSQGAQIDLLFDRDDEATTICEIKYTEEPFKIDKEYYSLLQRKIEIYRQVTRTSKQMFLALITASGLKTSAYSEEISHVVTLDDLFK